MEREVDRARKARIKAEEECAALKASLDNSGAKSELEAKLAEVQGQKASIEAETKDLTAEIEAAKAKLAGLKDALAEAQDGRRNDKLEGTRLTGELEKVNADKDDLEKEMALIVDQIGFLSEYSSKKAK
jgi:chromosome segregation ATPase